LVFVYGRKILEITTILGLRFLAGTDILLMLSDYFYSAVFIDGEDKKK
jgi:hypothetical protein